MHFSKNIIIALSTLSLVACANAHKMNSLDIGMTKKAVIERLGEPNSTSAISGIQYLAYNFYPTDESYWDCRPGNYYVRLVNGRVDSFGSMGDFDSTKVPETKSTVDINIKRK